MKTSMQLHIEDLEKIKQMIVSKSFDKDLEETITETINGCIENAESYLDKEKEHISIIVRQLKEMNNICQELVLEEGYPTDGFIDRFNKTLIETQKIILKY